METFRRSSFRQLAIGLVAGAAIFLCFLYLVSGVTFFMSYLAMPFLFVPDKLGLLEYVTPEEVITVTLPPGQEIEIAKPGKYFVYSNDLLPAEDRVLLLSQETQMQVETPMVMEGIYGYAADVVEGWAIAEFEIEQPGRYKIYVNMPGNDETEHRLSVVPNYSSWNGLVVFGSCLFHLIVIVFAGRLFYLWYNRGRIAQEKVERAAKRATIDEWMSKQKK